MITMINLVMLHLMEREREDKVLVDSMRLHFQIYLKIFLAILVVEDRGEDLAIEVTT